MLDIMKLMTQGAKNNKQATKKDTKGSWQPPPAPVSPRAESFMAQCPDLPSVEDLVNQPLITVVIGRDNSKGYPIPEFFEKVLALIDTINEARAAAAQEAERLSEIAETQIGAS
ncbi:MAG: hypothetical protein FWG09_02035, partial [Synergistaceae bacterium]|nr:hypothetical protein [Synergistaceae bacterium]